MTHDRRRSGVAARVLKRSQFLAAGITILMSTPYLDEAERCSRIVLLHEGPCSPSTNPALRGSMPGTLLEVLVASPRDILQQLRSAGGLATAQVFGDRLHVWLDHDNAPAAEAAFRQAAQRAQIDVTGVRAIVPSLEDVFIAKLHPTAQSPRGGGPGLSASHEATAP